METGQGRPERPLWPIVEVVPRLVEVEVVLPHFSGHLIHSDPCLPRHWDIFVFKLP